MEAEQPSIGRWVEPCGRAGIDRGSIVNSEPFFSRDRVEVVVITTRTSTESRLDIIRLSSNSPCYLLVPR